MDGYIQAQIVISDGYTDCDGETVPANVRWGGFVGCKYRANTLSKTGRYGGWKFAQMAFEITAEDMNFHANCIRLLDSAKRLVCEKEVQNIEMLEGVQRVRITVWYDDYKYRGN